MQKPESRLQRKIRDALVKNFGGLWDKIHGGPYQSAGIGDIVGCCRGRYFNIEVKMPGNKPTELQAKRIRDVNANGGCGAWVDSVEDAIDVVNEYFKTENVETPTKSE